MAVNHYLMTNEELINRFRTVIENNVEVEDRYNEYSLNFNALKCREYWDIHREILRRME
jgi:hypothetical protein